MTAPIRVSRASYVVDGAHLVTGVDLTVGAGEVVAVVGPNGAGKTTLLGLLAGDLVPTSGSVLVAGHDARDTSELSRERSVLPQHHLLRFAFRCLDVVMLGRYPHPTGEVEDRSVAIRSMSETDTDVLAERLFTTLSGGEQTRVSFARVLAQETPIVLLDEPTSSLDLRHQEMVMTTLRGIAADGGSVVAVLHDLNLAARYADRVALMASGSVLAVGEPRDVLTEPNLEGVYGCPVRVMEHPEFGTPLILPIGVGTGE